MAPADVAPVAGAEAAGPRPPVAERELQLTLPESEDPREAERRAVREAFAHTPQPVVMPGLVGANILVFVAMVVMGVSPVSPATDQLQAWGANYGPFVTAGEWWRLLTATFLHAGFPHLFFNMAVLLSIGSITERIFGHVSFAVLYLLSGLAGSIASVYMHPVATGVGASGAVFGLYGGLFGFLAVAGKSLPDDVMSTLRNGAVAFVLVNVALGTTVANVDMAAHLGGLAGGALAGIALALTGAVSTGVGGHRGWIVGCAGAAVVMLALLQLPVHDDWTAAVRTMTELEGSAVDRINESMQQVTDGRLGAKEFAGVVEARVVTPWRQHRDRIAGLRLPAREKALALKAVEYMDHRGAEWHLHAESFRREDASLLEQSHHEQLAAIKTGREFLQGLGVKPPPEQAAAPRASGADAGQGALARASGEVEKLETRLMAIYNESIGSAREGRLNGGSFANRVEAQIIKPWQAERERVAALRTSGPVEGMRKRLEDYMRMREEAWRLTAQGLRSASPALMTKARAAHDRASQSISEPAK